MVLSVHEEKVVAGTPSYFEDLEMLEEIRKGLQRVGLDITTEQHDGKVVHKVVKLSDK